MATTPGATNFTGLTVTPLLNPQGQNTPGTGNVEITAGNLTLDVGNIVLTAGGITGSAGTLTVANIASTGPQFQGVTPSAGAAGVTEWFPKFQPGLVLPTGALVVTLFTLTIPNVAAGGGFSAIITMTNKTSAGSSSRTAEITGSFQRVAGAVASGAVSALGSNIQADNGGGHGLTFGALAATQAGGATAVNTIAITCSITGATNTDTFDLLTSVQLLNLETNGAVLS